MQGITGLSTHSFAGTSLSAWQVCAFVKEVVGGDAIVMGNSLGGFTALAAASHAPDNIRVR